MASIFGGVEPPAWLVEQSTRNAERGQWGQLAGTLASGFLNGLRREKVEVPTYDQETGEQVGTQTVKGNRVGFRQGLFEARMNQADPMWRLKADQAQVGILSQLSDMEAAHALAQARKEELRGWMEDAPKLAPWLSATPEKRQTMPAPAEIKSQRGMTMLDRTQQSDALYWNRKEANEIRQQSSKIMADRVNRIMEWEGLITGSPVYAEIARLPNNGYILDSEGQKLTPSTEAQQIYNSWATQNDMLPFGVGKEQAASFRQSQKIEADQDNLTQREAGAMARKQADIGADKDLQAQRDAAAMARKQAEIDAQASRQDDRQEFQREMQQDAQEFKSNYLKDQEDYRMQRLEKSQSIYLSDPKTHTLPDGSTLVTWGRGMHTIPKKTDKAADLKLRTDVSIATKRITEARKALAGYEPGSKEYGQAESELIDAQMAMTKIFANNARQATEQEIRSAAESASKSKETVQQAVEGAKEAIKKFIFNAKTGRIEPQPQQ